MRPATSRTVIDPSASPARAMASPAATTPSSITRRYQPVRPFLSMGLAMAGSPLRAASLKQGRRGWLTSNSAVPARRRSPMRTSSSSSPSIVRFSPKNPGVRSSRPRSAAQSA